MLLLIDVKQKESDGLAESVGLNARRVWSLESSGHFSVKSLSKHLSPSSPLEKDYFKALRKTNSPRRINILVWIMAVGSLNCSKTIQRKLPNTCLLPSLCPLCLENSDLLIHFFIFCPFSPNCWFSIFSMLKSVRVFDGSFNANVLQLLRGPYLSFSNLG